MDAYFSIVSLRTHRQYSDQPISSEALERILQAGRATGSAQNRQPWRFIAVTRREVLDQLAAGVFEPNNLKGCRAAVAIVMARAGFDGGRCAQNMMLAAWSAGIVSTPNGSQDSELLARTLGLQEGETPATIISFGYPVRPQRLAGDSAGVLTRIQRKPLGELVTYIE